MIIVITAKGEKLNDFADHHFGRATGFIVFDTETADTKYQSNLENKNASQGAGTQAASEVAKLGASVVVSGSFGPKAEQALNAQNIKMWIFKGELRLEEIIDKINKGETGSF